MTLAGIFPIFTKSVGGQTGEGVAFLSSARVSARIAKPVVKSNIQAKVKGRSVRSCGNG